MTTHDRVDQLAALFPTDGPHDDDQTTEAARALAELVRFLNYATQRPTGATHPATLARVIASTQAALAGLDQLYRQTGRRLADLANRPDSYADNLGEPADPTYLAVGAVADLEMARAHLADAVGELGRAHTAANRIGLRGTE